MPPKGDLQLSIGYWIVSHKQTLRTWWGMSLMAIIALSLLWMIVFFSVSFSQEGKMNSLVVGSAQDAAGFSSTAFQPQALTVGAVTVIPRDDRYVDVVAELTNPNTEWAAQTISVHFTINGTAQPSQKLFVNQGDHRPVIMVNATVTNATTTTATLEIDDTTWARATAASLPAAVFTVANLQINPSTITVDGQSRSSVSISANVTNESVYNYYHVDVPIVALSGDRVVGVGLVGVDRWPTLTMRPLSLTFSYPLTGVTDVRIVPQVSRFDAGNTYR